MKYTSAGTPIIIAAVLDEAFLLVSFDDTGPGLPAGDVDRLFAKFHRGRDETSVGGAGLGLAICRAIIAAHGGQIEASQRPGGGARFSFTLPLNGTPSGGTTPAGTREPPRGEPPRSLRGPAIFTESLHPVRASLQFLYAAASTIGQLLCAGGDSVWTVCF